jgi:hypothetical protein
MQLIPLDFLPRKGAALKPPLISSQEGNCSQTFPPNAAMVPYKFQFHRKVLFSFCSQYFFNYQTYN